MLAALRLRTRTPRHLSWLLLCLALLLPVAQVAAASHGYAHTGEDVAAAHLQKKAASALHCDLCVTAAALHGGALPSAPMALPAPHAPHAAPLAAACDTPEAAPALAYRSRAPPLALR